MSFLKSFLKTFTTKLSSPYYSSTSSLRGLLYAIGVALLVFLVLTLVKPFGLESLPNGETVIIISGIIAFFAMLVAEFLLPLIAQSFYQESSWTLSKQLVQLFFMVILVVGGVSFYLANYTQAQINLGSTFITLVLASIIPILGFSLFQQNLHHNKYANKAEEIQANLANKGVITQNSVKILNFIGNSQTLNLIPNQLIYVKMEENSSEFFYQQPMGINSSKINIAEENVRKELAGHPQFVKFHEDIILNANAIQKISGTAGGFEVGIARVNEHLKVANKYRKNLENL